MRKLGIALLAGIVAQALGMAIWAPFTTTALAAQCDHGAPAPEVRLRCGERQVHVDACNA